MMTTQAGEIMSTFLKGYRWKFTCSTCASPTKATLLGTANCPAASVRFPGLLVCS
jgi:hypothetical protein